MSNGGGINGHSPDVLKTSLWEEKLLASCRNYHKMRMVLESKRKQRGTMAHEERGKDIHTWQPRMTRSRGERKGARVRGIQMAWTLTDRLW